MFHIYYNDAYSSEPAWCAMCTGWKVTLLGDPKVEHLLRFGDVEGVQSPGLFHSDVVDIIDRDLPSQNINLPKGGYFSYLLMGTIEFLVHSEDTPRRLDDETLRASLHDADSVPAGLPDALEACFPEGFELAPEPKSWLYSTNHAAATLSFGVKDGKKNVLIDTDSTCALDLSVAQRQQLERRYKGPETGDWILDLSRMG